MAVEDTFNGAKSGLTFLNAYINTVAEAIGEEQAHAWETTTCQALGTTQGMMIKDQIGVDKFDLKTSSKVLQNLIEEGFGIRSEVIEETPQTIKINVGRCPVYESMQALGMDGKAIEASCRGGSLGFMDAVAKQLNPEPQL
jgi:hypothetical protein